MRRPGAAPGDGTDGRNGDGMSGFLGATFWFIVTLGVLVTIHEFGHFWVARRCGVQVLKFSVGFGRPLWSRVARDGTRYQVAMIPLGGYVQFLDEREGDVAPAHRDRAFNRQPVWQRIEGGIAAASARRPMAATAEALAGSSAQTMASRRGAGSPAGTISPVRPGST